MARWFMIMVLLLSIPANISAMGQMPYGNDSLLDGKTAPEFTLETTAGVTKSLTQARAGKRTIMFFWATWCPHCHDEMDKISQNLTAIEQKGIQMVLVDVGEPREDAKAYLQHRKIALESFVDEDNTISGLYGVVGVPTFFFLDEKGVIRSIQHELPADYDSKFSSR